MVQDCGARLLVLAENLAILRLVTLEVALGVHAMGISSLQVACDMPRGTVRTRRKTQTQLGD